MTEACLDPLLAENVGFRVKDRSPLHQSDLCGRNPHPDASSLRTVGVSTALDAADGVVESTPDPSHPILPFDSTTDRAITH